MDTATPATPRQRRAAYLDRLARTINTASPADIGHFTCGQLRDSIRYGYDLMERGITRHQLTAVAKVYVFRLDRLGPEEFDRQSLAEALAATAAG